MSDDLTCATFPLFQKPIDNMANKKQWRAWDLGWKFTDKQSLSQVSV